MSLTIRPVEPGEAALVLRFNRKLAEYEKLLHEVEATEADIDRAHFGLSPRCHCDIALWNGTPVGFALWVYNFSTFKGKTGIYLEDLLVDPSMRGRGVGGALLEHLAQRCVTEGLPRLQWWVPDWNEPSIEFYKSIGGVPMDDCTVYRVSGVALERLAQ
jgi:GNAT superfamily N-acetyltransferase